ncbi:YqgE/AlgH family protein [Celeribacter marinus]|uniref:YqgE/AlgH family protein n=1 Tax=Celeribacter marinus TaxID=1397108 RepID=UPI003F6B5113
MFETTFNNLTGKLLVAMPGIGDPRFENSVIFMCAHSDDGSMGLIINQVSQDIRVNDVFEQLDINVTDMMAPLPVHFGGPVELGRGFVLHSVDYQADSASLAVDATYSMTASREILSDIARGGGPRERLLCLGYAGWGPGQLEEELAQNGWLTVDPTPKIVFEVPNDQKWEASVRSIGVSPALLSGEAGHA